MKRCCLNLARAFRTEQAGSAFRRTRPRQFLSRCARAQSTAAGWQPAKESAIPAVRVAARRQDDYVLILPARHDDYRTVERLFQSRQAQRVAPQAYSKVVARPARSFPRALPFLSPGFVLPAHTEPLRFHQAVRAILA